MSAGDDWVEGDSTLIENSFEEAYDGTELAFEAYDETELASFPEPEMEPTIEEYIEEYAKLTGADPAVLAHDAGAPSTQAEELPQGL